MKNFVKKISSVILGGILCAGLILPAACGAKHEHTFSETYSYNDTKHWYAATCGHDVKKGESAHVFNGNYECVCGYRHEHEYAEAYSYNDETHWKAATCGHDVKKDETAHVPDASGNCVCGYHGHVYTKWEYDDVKHWREPLCDDCERQEGNHVFNDEGSECTVCGRLSMSADAKPVADHKGYVVGNSIMSSEISSVGPTFNNLQYNPSSFIDGQNRLTKIGTANFRFGVDGSTRPTQKWQAVKNVYPKYEAITDLTEDISMTMRSFAPITPFDSHDMFLPAIISRFSVTNTANESKIIAVTLNWTSAATVDESLLFYSAGDQFEAVTKHKSLTAEVQVSAGATAEIIFGFGVYHINNEWRNSLTDIKAVSRFMSENVNRLESGINTFISLIPNLGDDTLRDYTAWYMQAAVILTKSAKDGNVITMGYYEMNTRDAFWTTFLHTIMFPDLERRMIEITASFQKENGKIPTTVLPMIEREIDLDINEYFCLRMSRYYNYQHDKEFLRENFDAYKKSVEFLVSRDLDKDGIPEQDVPENTENFWADWKDVRFLRGRKISPHVALLWLAVLRDGAALARELGDTATAENYDQMYEKAYEKVNADFTGSDDGGLWCEDHYNETWYDGKQRIHVLEDQCVGVFFNVIPKERIALLYSALEENMCEYGVRDTFPYRTKEDVLSTEDYFDEGGMYHNGGIWPWLNFMDMAGRYRNGRSAESAEIFNTLGYQDLVVPGNYRPNEYLHAETGSSMGLEIQGWSAAVIASVYFGAFEFSWQGDELSVTCYLPQNEAFSTNLILPKGKIGKFVSDGTGSVYGLV